MDKILNIKDLEKYRHNYPKASWRNKHTCVEYLVPLEWFEQFPESHKSGHGGINAKLEYAAEILTNKMKEVHDDRCKTWVSCYIQNLDETIMDNIEGALYTYDVFDERPELKEHPVVVAIRDAFFKYQHFKPHHALVSFYSADGMLDDLIGPTKEKMVKMLVEMNSWTDVVTNSSSEIFLCSSDKTADIIEHMVSNYSAEHDDWQSEVEVSPVDFEFEIKQAIVGEAGEEAMDWLDLNDYGITPEMIQEFEKLFREIHNMHSGTIFTIEISQHATETKDFLQDEFGAQYYESA